MSGLGVLRVTARIAVELEEASSRNAVALAVKSFKVKLAGSLPAEDEAKEAFARLFYAPKSRLTNAQKRRSRKHFISYVLLRFAQDNKALPQGQDLTAWTIEHIRPQRQAAGEVGSEPHHEAGRRVQDRPVLGREPRTW